MNQIRSGDFFGVELCTNIWTTMINKFHWCVIIAVKLLTYMKLKNALKHDDTEINNSSTAINTQTNTPYGNIWLVKVDNLFGCSGCPWANQHTKQPKTS